jgi:transcriptional regulator with XRE-family HTH domain
MIAEPKPYDFQLIGHNIRCSRMAINKTQAELAERAGVSPSTVRRLESGAPIQKRLLKKICDSLGRPISVVNAVMPYGEPGQFRPAHLHRCSDLTWFATGDRRPKTPEANDELIQTEEERLRIARLGLVSMFEAYMVTMPYGPSISQAVICRRQWISPNELYHECIVLCLGGNATVATGPERFHLSKGDALGFSTDLPTTIEPTHPVTKSVAPPHVLLILANRKGHSPLERRKVKRKRIRRRKSD